MTYPIKIEFKDYPSGSWINWSDYLTEPPTINKRVESENEGEAGVIVFDNASVSFYYHPAAAGGNPVYSAFSGDLSSKQRYLFRISAPKSNHNYVQLFEGVADFSTIKWTELDKVISFEVIDKLSALGVIPAEPARIESTLNSRILAQQPDAKYLSYFAGDTSNEIKLIPQDDYGLIELSSPVIFPGELLVDPQSVIDGSPVYSVVIASGIGSYNNLGTFIDVNDVTLAPMPFDSEGRTIRLDTDACKFAEKKLWGLDCNNITDGVLQSLDGLKVIRALYNQCWSGVTPILKPNTLTFPIPLEYAIRIITDEPLGGTPIDAIKTLANTMKCYIYINSAGNLVIHSKNNLGTTGTTRSLGSTKTLSLSKSYFWDKLVDGVTVNVKSWVMDDNGEYLAGTSTQTKQITGINAFIKPKNKITKDLLTPDSNENTQEELDARAASEAISILNFYGRRRASYELTLDLDDNILGGIAPGVAAKDDDNAAALDDFNIFAVDDHESVQLEPWELVDNINLPSTGGVGGGSLQYFFTGIEFDLVNRTVTLFPVEVTGHNYDFRQVVVGLSESENARVSSSGSGIVPSSGGVGVGLDDVKQSYGYSFEVNNTGDSQSKNTLVVNASENAGGTVTFSIVVIASFQNNSFNAVYYFTATAGNVESGGSAGEGVFTAELYRITGIAGDPLNASLKPVVQWSPAAAGGNTRTLQVICPGFYCGYKILINCSSYRLTIEEA